MPIEETGSYVDDFSTTVSANKPTSNPGKRADGAGELRKLKAILKSTFTNLDGPVTITDTEANYLAGVTSAVQTQINSRFTTGDLLASYNLAAPTGWHRITTANLDNRMLRIVASSTSNTVGGTHSPILMNVVPAHTHSYSGTTSSNGSHTHGPHIWIYVGGGGVTTLGRNTGDQDWHGLVDSSGIHTHTFSGNTATQNGASNWAPRYIDFMLIQKD